MSLEQFEALTNEHGLVPMRIVDPFAPYIENAIAGFPPVTAEHLFTNKAAVPINEDGEVITIEGTQVPEVEPPANHAVEIPENWKSLHHLQRIRLAKALGNLPDEIRLTVADADTALEAEVERRSQGHGQSNET